MGVGYTFGSVSPAALNAVMQMKPVLGVQFFFPQSILKQLSVKSTVNEM
jgi:hypothetical protein